MAGYRHKAHHIRVDWWRLIVDMGRPDDDRPVMTIAAVAMIVDVSPSTLHGWKMGATPKHPEGERLIDLWCRHTGKTRAELPYTDAYAWTR